jgi:ribosome assembly protein RRB1
MQLQLHPAESDDENSDEEDDDDEGLDDDPTIEHINVNHAGGVNRVRSMPQKPGMIATMADTGKAHIFDLTANLASMMGKGPRVHAPQTKPTFTYSGHQEEGYAIDWNPVVPGRLATGDCAGKIRLWNPTASNGAAGAGSWQVDNTPFSGHTASVEDLQWSPTEGTVLSSASADRTVRIWDIRDNTKPQITVDAHSEDVNVISWNRNVAYLLASGCDDGSFKVHNFSCPSCFATCPASSVLHSDLI